MRKRRWRFAEWVLFAGFWVFLLLGMDSRSRWTLHFTAVAGILGLVLLVLWLLRLSRRNEGDP